MLLRLALRDLLHQRALSLFFVVNVALGLAGSLTLDGVESSVRDALTERSRAMMGADLTVSSNRPLTDDEDAAFVATALPVATSEAVQLYSMVRGSGAARLTEVRAIDEQFPLRGAVVLARTGPVDDEARHALARESAAWADPSLLGPLGIAVGDSVHVGEKRFRIVDTIERDTGASVRATSLAPRLYVAREHLDATGLVRRGSRIEYLRFGALAEGVDARATAAVLRATLVDPAISVRSHEEAAQSLSGAYERVTSYLGLVALVALALAGVSCAYLFRAFLRRRVVDLAILMSVGATRARARTLLVLELGILGGVAAILASLLAIALLPLAGGALADLLPEDVRLDLGASQMGHAWIVAWLIGPLCCLPLLGRLGGLRVAELFQEHASLALQRRRREWIGYVPAVAVLAALSIHRAGDVEQGLGFVIALAVAFAVVAVVGRAWLAGAQSLEHRGPIALRLALRQLAPRRRASLTAFVALAMSVSLSSLPLQLRSVLDRRLAPPPSAQMPSLFLFDIQPEQIEALHAKVREHGVDLQRLAPMVRARWLVKNGEAVDFATSASVDPERRERMRSRVYNLTWQVALASTETLVAGREFSGTYDANDGGPAEASVEEDWARDMGVGIGDVLRFDVQGVVVDARIVNLRRVDWNSMQPNFFVSLQPGVLEDAPAVYLASVAALADERREALQLALVEAFPNVSIIDVSRGVERVLGFVDQLQWALAASAFVSLAVGLVLVFAIAADEAHARRWDVNLLKVLGARHRTLRRSLDLEFGIVGFAAAFLGALVALGIAALIALRFLDVAWAPSWRGPALLLVVMPVIVAAAARLAMRRVLTQKPVAFLR